MTGYRTLFSLEGKTALVTGANGGLGRAISELLASAGARLIISDHDQDSVGKALSGIAGDHMGLPLNLDDLPLTRAKMQMLIQAGNIPDCLVLNAGIQGPASSLSEVSDADWQQVMTVNLASAHAITSVLAPAMAGNGGGSIILMASIAALRGSKAIGLYGMTKAALAQLARNLAVEWGPMNIRANAIAPGLIRTPLATDLMNNQSFMERRLSMTPLRRVGAPNEVAATVLLLASDGGAFITGQTIVIDGGTLISDGS